MSLTIKNVTIAAALIAATVVGTILYIGPRSSTAGASTSGTTLSNAIAICNGLEVGTGHNLSAITITAAGVSSGFQGFGSFFVRIKQT